MVGTAVYQVGASSATHSKNEGARNPGAQIVLPPAATEDNNAPTSPWMWKRGMTFRQRSTSISSSAAATLCAEKHSLWFVSGTSFGRDVAPDVCRTSATSCGST